MQLLPKFFYTQGLFGWNYAYLFSHPHIIIRESFLRVKWFIQRGVRGYSDSDTWNLANYLSDWMPKAIYKLKGRGTPIQVFIDLFGDHVDLNIISDEMNEAAHQRWHEILDTIAVGFEAHKQLDEFIFRPDTQEYKDSLIRMHNGFALFCTYYCNLWN